MEILNCSNNWPDPFQRGYYYKMRQGHLKIFSRTTKPEELKFTLKLSDIM
jgi:hypothetical protein